MQTTNDFIGNEAMVMYKQGITTPFIIRAMDRRGTIGLYGNIDDPLINSPP
jgi:hypothetical protein